MTSAPTLLADLLAECDARGIRLTLAEGGGLTIDAPPAALTADLLDRLKAHKAALLDTLRLPTERPTVEPEAAESEIETAELDPDGWPLDCLDPAEVTPCPKCGTLELWQSVVGDLYAKTDGRWRCQICDPPAAAERFLERSERIRQRVLRKANR